MSVLSHPGQPLIRKSVAALVLLILMQGCASTATRQKEAAARAAPEIVAQAITAGDAAYGRGDFDNALVEYVKAATTDPRNVQALNRIARTHDQLGDAAVAIDAYRQTLAIEPDNAEANEGCGLILLRMQNRGVAKQLLTAATLKNPRLWRSYNGLGVIADLAGDYTGAEASYRKAYALSPRHGEVLNNLGYSRYLAGRLDEAQGYFQQALASEPDNSKAWSNLGLVYTRRGRYPEAVAAFDELMSEPEAYYSTGYICMLDHRYDDAAQLFRKAIQLSPSYYDAAHRSLARVERDAALMQSTTGASPRP